MNDKQTVMLYAVELRHGYRFTNDELDEACRVLKVDMSSDTSWNLNDYDLKQAQRLVELRRKWPDILIYTSDGVDVIAVDCAEGARHLTMTYPGFRIERIPSTTYDWDFDYRG